MRRSTFLAGFLSSLLVLAAAGTSRGTGVLQQVPEDALGFVVVKDMSDTDAKVARLLKTLNVNVPGPLAFLRAATGVSEGLDPQGDFLLAVFPDDTADNAHRFGVWLPVRDYERLLASLDAVAEEPVAAITVAGEDLLIARHGNWALVMDPDQRERMERILAEEPRPPAAVAAWADWIAGNDVAVVALPGGMRAVQAWIETTPASGDPDAGDESLGFEPASAAADGFAAGSDDMRARVAGEARRWIDTSPRLARMALDADAVGLAVRLHADGGALAGVRLAGSEKHPVFDSGAVRRRLPAALYRDGDFVLHAAGSLPPALASAVAELFTRSAMHDLRTEHRLVLDEAEVARFQQALQNAVAEVSSALALTHPGDESAGIYTNSYLVVRTGSAESFVELAREVMQAWNRLNREAEGESLMSFDVQETKLGERMAICYSLDVAGEEAMALPEVRQAMEQFFGPGGKMQLWLTRVDDETVLLASATQAEVVDALATLERQQPIRWHRGKMEPADSMLAAESDWRLFFSPHAYAAWLKRYNDAMTGPVIGGGPARHFPEAPPVGVAGGLRGRELWIELAAPAATIGATAEFWRE